MKFPAAPNERGSYPVGTPRDFPCLHWTACRMLQASAAINLHGLALGSHTNLLPVRGWHGPIPRPGMPLGRSWASWREVRPTVGRPLPRSLPLLLPPPYCFFLVSAAAAASASCLHLLLAARRASASSSRQSCCFLCCCFQVTLVFSSVAQALQRPQPLTCKSPHSLPSRFLLNPFNPPYSSS